MTNLDKLLYTVTEAKKKRVIIDTDAACEADDPFAIAQALMSKMLDVKAIFAEHFVEAGSMEKSYDVIQDILQAMDMSVPVFYGEPGKISECPEDEVSPAAQFLITEALREDERPLYVMCLGAITNIASAIRKCPEISTKMTIVWIGGNPHNCGSVVSPEFNCGNDVDAVNIVFGSGTEVWQIPNTVYGTMHIGFAEIQNRIYPYGKIGKYLFENLIQFYSSDRAGWSAGESWSLGDSPAVGVTLEPNCGSFEYRPAPVVRPDTSYEFPENRPMIRVYRSINSRFIIEDFINKLQLLYGVEK